jgi:hypothetical protein
MLDLRRIPTVIAREAQVQIPENELSVVQQKPLIHPNPLQEQKSNPFTVLLPVQTQTVPARTVYHEANAALRPLISGIQTQEQLDDLINELGELR